MERLQNFNIIRTKLCNKNLASILNLGSAIASKIKTKIETATDKEPFITRVSNSLSRYWINKENVAVVTKKRPK